jgi:CheY-like chemotaxis protein
MVPPGRPKVLICDDDKAVASLVAGMLRPAGYDVIMAFDPVQGYRMVLQEKPSLVLLDLQMPAGGGVQMLDHLLASTKTHSIPVIILSATPASEKAAELRAHGAVAYLEKPIDAAVLLEAVRSVFHAD